MKRRTALKIACAAVAAITALSACACGDKGGGKVADVTIRSAISAVDVLADKSYDNLGDKVRSYRRPQRVRKQSVDFYARRGRKIV